MDKVILNLLENTISDINRKILYTLLSQCNIKELFNYMNNLIDTINVSKQAFKRENFVGIKNLGSTCYMNSILQQFFVIKDFRELVFSLRYDPTLVETEVNQKKIIDDFLYQLQKLYAHLYLSHKKSYDPLEFCLTLKNPQTGKPINTAIQEDAHEFLNTLFQKLERYLKIDRKNSMICEPEELQKK